MGNEGCQTPVEVLDPFTGEIIRVTPLKVWTLTLVERRLLIRRRRTIKVGLFQSPSTGRYFRATLPKDCQA